MSDSEQNIKNIQDEIKKLTSEAILDIIHNREEGLRKLEKALSLDPNNTTAHLMKSLYLQDINEYEAEKEIRKAIELSPNNKECHEALVELLIHQCEKGWNRESEAIHEVEKIIELDPFDVWAYQNLVSLLSSLCCYDEAIQVGEKCLRMIRKTKNIRISRFALNLLLSELAGAYELKGNCSKAISVYRMQVSLDSSSYNFEKLGDLYTKLGEYEKAEEMYQRAIEIIEKTNQITEQEKELLAKLRAKLVNIENLQEYNYGFYKAKTSGELIWIADILFEKGNYIIAEEKYKEALKLDPSNPSAYFKLGIAMEKLKKYDEAIQMYEKVLTLDFQHYEALSHLVELHESLKRYDEAIKAQEHLIAIHSPDKKTEDGYWEWEELAKLYEDMKKYDEAEKIYREAITLNPLNPSAHIDLAFLLMSTQEYKKAYKEFKTAIKLRPLSPYPHLFFGSFLKECKRYTEAKREIEESLKLGPMASDINQFARQELSEIEQFLQPSKGKMVIKKKHNYGLYFLTLSFLSALLSSAEQNIELRSLSIFPVILHNILVTLVSGGALYFLVLWCMELIRCRGGIERPENKTLKLIINILFTISIILIIITTLLTMTK